MRRSRRFVLGATLTALVLVLGACGSGEDDNEGTAGTGGGEEIERGEVTVGVSGAFAESQIMAEMYTQVLENAGYTVDTQLDLDSREISFKALERGEIDVVPEYLSSLLLYLDPKAESSGDSQGNVSLLEPLLEEKGVTILEPSPAQDQNAFVVTSDTADAEGLASMSDLAAVAGDMTLGGPPECPERPFCIPGLKDTYGIEFAEFKPLDVGGPLTVEALDSGEIDVGLLFSTDPVIEARGFVLLEDDKSLQNAENITPVVSDEVLNDEITELLNAVSAALDTETMTSLVGKVVNDKEDPADVAEGFLTEKGLL
jgi:osmoprotectant transport system substrate-binding protein